MLYWGKILMATKFSYAENPRREATNKKEESKEASNNIAAQTFTFRELASATKNFRQECLIGEGGFGRVYKGQLEKTGQVTKDSRLWHGLVLIYVFLQLFGITLILVNYFRLQL